MKSHLNITAKTLLVYLIICLIIVLPSCIRKSQSNSQEAEYPKAFDTSYINKQVNPVANFDSFVNSKWQDTAKLPAGYPRWGAFNVLNEQNEIKIKSLIQNALHAKNKVGTPNQQVADLYKSFMDSALIEQKGVSPILPILNEIDKISSLNSLVFLFFNKYDRHITSWLDFYIEPDARKSTMNAVYVVQSGLSIGDRDYYVVKNDRNKMILNEFEKLLTKYFIALKEDSSSAVQKAKKIVSLETEIAKLHITKEEKRDPVKTYNKISKKDLITKYPNLFFDKMFQNLPNILDSVIVENLLYLTKMNDLLGTVELATIKNWFKFQFINENAPFLSTTFKEAKRYFFKEVLYGIKTEMPADKKAIKLINSELGNIIGKIFVEKYFPAESKSKVSQMIENMRSVYKTRIEQNEWMSPETKKEALKKLSAFTYKIGYPDKWKDYSTITINQSQLVENLMHIKEWEYNEKIKKIGKPVDKSEWYMSPQMVNAYYNPLANEIVFPAGILQPPFYNPIADDAINYGGILGVIGHEFTHGFDDQGAQFDETGNLRVWWKEEDKKQFLKRGEALGKAYSNYTGLKTKSKINAQFTMGENIADLGGITLAYNALLKSIEGKEAPKDIDGYNYKQRFFLGWAQVWRGISTAEYEKNQVINDPHSPSNARINVTLSLFPEFYTAWGQTPPKDLVKIW